MSRRSADVEVHPSSELRFAAQAARARKRILAQHGPGALGHQRPQTQEHYHVVYHIPAENVAIPYFKEVFATARDAYLKLAQLGKLAEPRAEWYDDGEVGFETGMPGRTGVYWVVVEVMGCVRWSCRQFMTRDMRKMTFKVVPDDGEVVRTETNPLAVAVLGPGSITDEREL